MTCTFSAGKKVGSFGHEKLLRLFRFQPFSIFGHLVVAPASFSLICFFNGKHGNVSIQIVMYHWQKVNQDPAIQQKPKETKILN